MRAYLTLLALPIAMFVACSDTSSPGSGSGTGGAATPQAGSMSMPNAGMSTTNGGSGSGAAGAASGAPSAGGAAMGGARGGAPASASSGKDGSGGSIAGTIGTSGAGAAGGSTGGGAGATSEAGSGGNGGGNPTDCTRELMKNTIDVYFKALAAHDASMLPLADNVKFTENGKAGKIGDAGLWKTAGALKYVHSALDTKTCNSASQAVVPDGTMDIPVALRIKLQDAKITEVETIAVRPGDYKVSGSNFNSNTEALAASKDNCDWLEPVPADKRNTYEELTGWISKYFRMFPSGVCNTTSDCKRLENGGGSFNCTLGATCAAGEPGPADNAMPARLVFADVEMGIGVGFTMFQKQDTDVHMFKMSGGMVLCVSAILGAAPSSGWE